MKRRFFALFLVLTIVFTGFPSLAVDNYANSRENEIIVKFKDYETSSYSNLTNDSKKIDESTRLVRVGDRDIDGLIDQLEGDPAIEYVEKNYIYKQTNIVNDPYYDNLWHLDNIKAENAWIEMGEDHEEVVVSVIDSGIDISHPDLRNRIAPGGYNFLEDSSNIYDISGHGSFVAGIISAEANNNYGITGLAGQADVRILPLLVSDHWGGSSVYDIVRAIDYSIEQDVDVINLSLGGPNYSRTFKDAVGRALRANIVVVAAAGNEALRDNDIFYPASYEGVLSVGATDSDNERALFSSYNDHLDLVAPGANIYSTSPASSFSYDSGSSYAGPMVSATAALLKSINPELSVDEIREILISTAVDLGEVGKDPYYGHGLIDMEEAVKSQVPTFADSDDYEDFDQIRAGREQIFRVAFNLDLDEESLDDNIFLSSDPSGQRRDLSYKLELDSNEGSIVYLKPVETWDKGYKYLFINDRVMGLNGRQHKKKLRVPILVE